VGPLSQREKRGGERGSGWGRKRRRHAGPGDSERRGREVSARGPAEGGEDGPAWPTRGEGRGGPGGKGERELLGWARRGSGLPLLFLFFLLFFSTLKHSNNTI
jgi:hypothetical protein